MSLPVLETERLRLRPIAEQDAEGLHAAYGNAEAMRYWDFPPSRDLAETAARIRQSLGVDERWHGAWGLRLCRGGFVGMINYHHREPWNRRLELGWIMVPAFWRRGLMSEALGAVLRHCFTAMDVHRVEATIEPENRASLALAAKFGFVPEGGPMRDRLLVSGSFRSVGMHALLKPDWQRRGG
ncbi:MAG TPA: GNAT family N-acetyltransferase [Candidatus Sulfotelmatobacter sp.]|nr:GNAT family N-acetyltransferase [Candidatus Sulfotelmatobacter sp.]